MMVAIEFQLTCGNSIFSRFLDWVSKQRRAAVSPTLRRKKRAATVATRSSTVMIL